MDIEALAVIYEQYLAKGYTHSQARARCKDFEAQYKELRRRRGPYNFADMADSLPHGGRSDAYSTYDCDYDSTPRPAYRTTERHCPPPRHVDEETYYQEELRSPRTPASGAQGYYPGTEYYEDHSRSYHGFSGPAPPSARYHTEERRPHSEPSSRAHEYNPFSADPPRPNRTYTSRPYSTYDDAPPSARYHTEERRPHPGPSSRAHEYNTFSTDSPRPKRTYTGRSYSTYDAAPPPRPGRAYTDNPRYNTSEHVPRDTPQHHYPSGRDSSPPRFSRVPPRSQYADSSSSSSSSYSSRAQSPPPPAAANKLNLDLYVVLGIQRSATADEIKKAHRKLCMKWHPDRCAEADKEFVTEKMAEMNQARDVLSDAKTKEFYDRTGCLPGLWD